LSIAKQAASVSEDRLIVAAVCDRRVFAINVAHIERRPDGKWRDTSTPRRHSDQPINPPGVNAS
jgi:hypothetical protein